MKQIPVSISRWDLLNTVRNTPGFVSFSMSEPLKTQNFVRYAWVSFESEEACRKAKDLLEHVAIQDFILNPVKSMT
ncbi:MAG: RNA recognition motif domain-containing protein [Candidatus Roizmanbacteria bacterium]